MLKRVLRSAAVQSIFCALAALYIQLVRSTCRWTIVRGEVPEKLWQSSHPFILCFWHGRLLLMPHCWRRDRPIHMLISQHRDGQLIAKTVRHFGIHWLAGSSTRGGTEALRAMVKVLKAGEYVGITPDGPRGPRMRASDGIVGIARLSGVPIIAAAYSASHGKVLGSWDGFLLARPFSRGVIVWGEPITIPKDAAGDALEAYRKQVEDRLNAVTREADELTGRPPVRPAPAEAQDGPSG